MDPSQSTIKLNQASSDFDWFRTKNLLNLSEGDDLMFEPEPYSHRIGINLAVEPPLLREGVAACFELYLPFFHLSQESNHSSFIHSFI